MDTHYDDSQNNYAEWRKSYNIEYILYDSIYLNFWEIQPNVEWLKSNQGRLPEFIGGGGIGRGSREGLQRCMRHHLTLMDICSLSWLWLWFSGCIHMSKLTKLHTWFICSLSCHLWFSKSVKKPWEIPFIALSSLGNWR